MDYRSKCKIVEKYTQDRLSDVGIEKEFLNVALSMTH